WAGLAAIGSSARRVHPINPTTAKRETPPIASVRFKVEVKYISPPRLRLQAGRQRKGELVRARTNGAGSRRRGGEFPVKRPLQAFWHAVSAARPKRSKAF